MCFGVEEQEGSLFNPSGSSSSKISSRRLGALQSISCFLDEGQSEGGGNSGSRHSLNVSYKRLGIILSRTGQEV